MRIPMLLAAIRLARSPAWHRHLHGRGGLAVPARGGRNPSGRDRRYLSPPRRPRLAHCGWCPRPRVRSLARRCQLFGFGVSETINPFFLCIDSHPLRIKPFRHEQHRPYVPGERSHRHLN